MADLFRILRAEISACSFEVRSYSRSKAVLQQWILRGTGEAGCLAAFGA
jgi:hypothetical protein